MDEHRGKEGDGKNSLEREVDKERQGAKRKRRGERKSDEKEGEKEMQRLPYNGAPRAHKLRHNVISSSLFNERWQRAAHTFYPGVLVIPAPVVLASRSLSLSPSFSRCSLQCPTIGPLRELVASHALRCVVKSRFQT